MAYYQKLENKGIAKKYLYQHPLDDFSFIFLLTYEETKVYLAQDDNKILALLGILEGKFIDNSNSNLNISLVGEDPAIAVNLWEKFKPAHPNAPERIYPYSTSIRREMLKRFPKFSFPQNLLMVVNRETFRDYPSPQAFKLTDADLPDFRAVSLTKRTAEDLKKGWILYGIRYEGKPATITSAYQFIPSLGGFVLSNFTIPEYRGKGFSTQAMAALVREILKDYPHVLLGVSPEAHPAYHIYSKLGFKKDSVKYFL